MTNKIDEIEHIAKTAMAVAESLTEKIGPLCEDFKQKADTNKDGKVSLKEGMDSMLIWGGEMLNGEGFKMLLFNLFSIIFMLCMDLLVSYFDLLSHNSIWGVIGKVVAVSILTYGWKTVLAKSDNEKAKLVDIIHQKDSIIQEKNEVIHADHLAIEMLKFQQKD